MATHTRMSAAQRVLIDVIHEDVNEGMDAPPALLNTSTSVELRKAKPARAVAGTSASATMLEPLVNLVNKSSEYYAWAEGKDGEQFMASMRQKFQQITHQQEMFIT